MDALTLIVLTFAVLGGIDYAIGCKFGIGKEFETGFMMLGTVALAIIGMVVISPLIADLLKPFFDFVYTTFHLDPSIVPASIFANDMGGGSLSQEVAKNAETGAFNGFVVASMMGCTVSFTIPFCMRAVCKEQQRDALLGLLCGIVTIPVGCFVAGLICGLSVITLIIDLLPIIILSGVIAFGLVKFQDICVKIFRVLGFLIKLVLVTGLLFGIINFLSGKEIIPGLETIENAGFICINATIVMSGTFPLIYVVSKLLKKPLDLFGKKLGINSISALGFLATLASSVTTFGMMNKMDKKGVMLNSAFAVSAAFTFAAHLAYTMAVDSTMILPMIIGKIISGITALLLAVVLSKKFEKVS